MIQILRFPPMLVSMLTLITRWIPMSAHKSIELPLHLSTIKLIQTPYLIVPNGTAPHSPLSPFRRGESEGAVCQKTKCVCINWVFAASTFTNYSPKKAFWMISALRSSLPVPW